MHGPGEGMLLRRRLDCSAKAIGSLPMPDSGSRNKRMALRITTDCIVCGACDYVCANDAITPSTSAYSIIAARCTECVGEFDSPRCVVVCPVDCIFPAAPDQGHPSEGSRV